MSTVPAESETASAREPEVVYERELACSVERIWENVLDWEHLPYLHSQAFTTIELKSSDAEGWRAEVGLPSGGSAIVDVRLDRPKLRYTSSTVDGLGAGTAIVTQLLPRSEHRTGIRVEFHLPWAPRESAAAVGSFYRDLYVGLWDQDETMMRERQRLLDALAAQDRGASASPSSVVLGRVSEMASKLPMDVELGGRRFRVIAHEGRILAFDTRCPHLGGPLAERPGSCEIVCPWHGYRFDLASGESSDGRALRLARSAVVEVNACEGEVRLRLP